MDHDDALLWEQVVRRKGVDERGPIAEFLAKKDAEQARQTGNSYRTALNRFRNFLGEDDKVSEVDGAEAEGGELVGGGLSGHHPCSEGEPYQQQTTAVTRVPPKAWSPRRYVPCWPAPPIVERSRRSLEATGRAMLPQPARAAGCTAPDGPRT